MEPMKHSNKQKMEMHNIKDVISDINELLMPVPYPLAHIFLPVLQCSIAKTKIKQKNQTITLTDYN